MSANLDLVRSLYAHWERGDYRSSEWADPEIEWVIADGPDPGTWVGVAGMAEGFRSSMGVWRDVHAEVEAYREIDSERVLVLEWRRARGKASGLELGKMRAEGAVLFHLRDAKVRRLVFYWDRARALADLSLDEQAVSANLTLVRSMYADRERGDYASAPWARPISNVRADGPEPGSWTGVAEMIEQWRVFLDTREDWQTSPPGEDRAEALGSVGLEE